MHGFLSSNNLYSLSKSFIYVRFCFNFFWYQKLFESNLCLVLLIKVLFFFSPLSMKKFIFLHKFIFVFIPCCKFIFVFVQYFKFTFVFVQYVKFIFVFVQYFKFIFVFVPYFKFIFVFVPYLIGAILSKWVWKALSTICWKEMREMR